MLKIPRGDLPFGDQWILLWATFWSKVDRSGGPNECWPWIGATRGGKFKYGLLNVGGRMATASRLALALVGKHPDGDKVAALHSCDNPICCNPEHLRWGTRAENSRDAARRNRSPNRRMSNETAEEILREYRKLPTGPGGRITWPARRHLRTFLTEKNVTWYQFCNLRTASNQWKHVHEEAM